MRRIAAMLVLAILAMLLTGSALAAEVTVPAALETEPFLDNDASDADADDPAIWVHPTDASKSVVVGTLKNGGLAVFDLDGRTIQRIDYDDEDARQNNVDLLYGARIGGRTEDLAVVTERGLDHLRIFGIAPDGAAAAEPLVERTVEDPPVLFEGDTDIAGYGVATWHGKHGTPYVAVSQRHRTTLVLLRLVPAPDDRIGWEEVDRIELPSTFSLPGGVSWSPCAEEEGELPQVEGMVADARRGILYAAQEDVGIWRIRVGGGHLGRARLLDRVREFGQPFTRTFDPEEEEFVCEVDGDAPSFGNPDLAADSEGLTIYRRAGGRGYLLASSQGSSEFLVYGLPSGRQLRTFAIGGGPTDPVDESDGAMVVGVPLGPAFPEGLLVVHDGADEPSEDATNFKFVDWRGVAGPLGLEIDTASGDPRR